MSWDVLAFQAPAAFKSPRKDDLPEGWEPKPFGLRSEVQAKLASMLPGIQFSTVNQSLWGMWSTAAYSLEINLGEQESIAYVWVAARSDIEQAVGKITEILAALELRGVDLQAGEFLDSSAPQKSIREWRDAVERYRNQQIKR